MSSSFGKPIVNKMRKRYLVCGWMMLHIKMFQVRLRLQPRNSSLTSILSQAGKIFQSLPPAALNDIAGEEAFLIRLKAFNNSKGKTR